QGATPAMRFVVGDLPEIVEQEIDGDPVPVKVTLPVTINGRIFPREDIDVWTFAAKKGETILCEVNAARLGSPLEARLEVLDAQGVRLAESDNTGPDPRVRFTAPADGEYQARIQDARFSGGQAFVYRLTLSAEPHVDYCYPLGGRRGSKLGLMLAGQGVPTQRVAIDLPATREPEFRTHVRVGDRKTSEFLLALDELPEHVKSILPNTSEDAREG